jgi:hypothetical protein
VPLSLRELRQWVPEIADLARATRDMAANHTNSTAFYRDVVKASTWQGEAAQTAITSMQLAAAAHDVKATDLSTAAAAMDHDEQDAAKLAHTVQTIVDDADAAPAVEIDQSTNQVSPPPTYDHLDAATKTRISEKIADLEARIADALDEGDRIDADLAQAIAKATGTPPPTKPATSLGDLMGVPKDRPLLPGEVRNNGPVVGTGAKPGVPGIKAADLGEVITLPDGHHVAVLGDSYGKPQVGPPDDHSNPHYGSVAVPVTFDARGRPHFGAPLNGTEGSPNVLFPLPPKAAAAGANNALPAGSITGRDGKTYMMVVGTNTTEGLDPKGGSWLVEVTNDPAAGWQPVEQSWRSTQPFLPDHTPNPDYSPVTQISGHQRNDGMTYIAADAFDRSQGVSMYRVDPDNIADRNHWQPYNPANATWGQAGQPATTMTPGQNWGELSFRDVDGQPVLAGTNLNSDTTKIPTVEVHVGGVPTEVLNPDSSTKTVVMTNAPDSSNFVPAPYGGYILPGSTLDNLGLFGSQWYQPPGGPVHYDVQDIQANVKPGP